MFNNANKSSYKAFEGIIISLKYNKAIKNRTIVSTKGDLTKKQDLLCSFGISAVAALHIFRHGYSNLKLFIAIAFIVISLIFTLYLRAYEEPLHKVILEDPKFNRRFNVYSSNQVEARYLVTPLFMELLNNLNASFGVKK